MTYSKVEYTLYNGKKISVIYDDHDVCHVTKDDIEILLDWYQQGRADAIDEIRRAMYHQCFECDNGEDMQKWDSGNWFRYRQVSFGVKIICF